MIHRAVPVSRNQCPMSKVPETKSPSVQGLEFRVPVKESRVQAKAQRSQAAMVQGPGLRAQGFRVKDLRVQGPKVFVS